MLRHQNFRQILIICIAGLALSGVASAQDDAQAETLDLSGALNRFAAEQNIEILFDPELVSGARVNALISGDTTHDRLENLLQGTDLVAVEVDADVFVVQSSRDLAGAAMPASSTGAAPVPARQDTSNEISSSASALPASGEGLRGTLAGTVTDENTGAGLSGAIVRIEGTEQTTSTNSRGEYRFSAVPPGQYTIIVDYLGTQQFIASVTVEADARAELNFAIPYQLDTITVFGSRSALAQALNQQRAAPNATTVVASDLLGSFPAETVAEALRRVPGVAFERDDATGEGARISVRGFNSEAINIELNGVALQGTGIDRTVDLSGVLADNISQITIQKTLLPSQEANGSGGLVEIETRSGLEYDQRYFSFGLEREQSPDSEFGDELQASMVAAYEFTPNFGIVGTLNYRDTDRSNLDINYIDRIPPVLPEGFTSLFRLPETFDFPFDPEAPQRLIAGASYVDRLRTEENLVASLNVAWDISYHTRLRLDFQHINQDLRDQTSRSIQSFLASSVDMPVPELNNEVRRRTYLRSYRPGLELRDEADELTVNNFSFRGETNWNAWDFGYKAGYNDTERSRQILFLGFSSDQITDIVSLIDPSTIVINPDDDAANTDRVVDGGVIIEGDRIPALSFTDAGFALANNPDTYTLQTGTFADTLLPTETMDFEGSARYNSTLGWLNYVELGGSYDTTERANSDDFFLPNDVSSSLQYSRVFGQDAISLSDIAPGALTGRDLGYVGVPGYSVPYLGFGLAQFIFDQLAGFVEDDPTTPENEARLRFTDRLLDPIQQLGAISPATITEDTLALYFESSLSFGKLDLVGGLRFERSERASTAITSPSVRLNLPGAQFEPRQTFINAGLIRFDEIGGTDDTLTPSLLATWRESEQLILRLGYFRSTTNPSIQLINRPPQLIVDLREGRQRATIREANPDLEPTIVDNFDLDIAYYFKESTGLVRAAFFWKETSNNFTSILRADREADIRDRVLAQLEPLAATRPDLVDFEQDAEFFLSRPTNGDGGSVYGVELEAIRQLDFLPDGAPAWLENVQLLANVTWTDGEFETLVNARNENGDAITLSLDRPFLRQSEWSGTASIAYEDRGFSGRLIYSYQSAAVSSYDEFNLNGVIPEFDTLDLRLSYAWGGKNGGPSYIVYLEGDDLLTDAKDADVRSGTGSLNGEGSPSFFFPERLQFNGGRTFTLGGRITF